jgi:hypothetical protein
MAAGQLDGGELARTDDPHPPGLDEGHECRVDHAFLAAGEICDLVRVERHDSLPSEPGPRSHRGTDGGRARSPPTPRPGFEPATIAESNSQNARLNAQYRQLANVVILTSLPIAGCTLAVSVVAGLNDRRRPFGLLRLTGARLSTLRRVVLLESAVPLLVGSAVAVGTGFLVAALFLRSQLGYPLHAPGAAYYLAVAAGLLAALAVLASTLPVLRRITAPEAARFE